MRKAAHIVVLVAGDVGHMMAADNVRDSVVASLDHTPVASAVEQEEWDRRTPFGDNMRSIRFEPS